MPKTVGTEWFNENSLRNYPVSQSATLTASNLDFALPDNFLVDMKLFVPYISGLHPTGFYISAITVYPQGMVFTIGYKDSTLDLPAIAASAPILFSTFTPYSTIEINGLQSSATTVNLSQIYGFAAIGSVTSFTSLSGRLDFTQAATRLESTAISFGIKRLSGIRVASNGAETAVLQGQLVLRSGSNHEISVLTGNTATTLTFNAISTSGFTESCGCNDVALGPPIRTINNQSPDASGNFTLAAGDCVSIEGANSGLVVKETCAKPCCGCSELDIVNQDLELLRTQVSSLSAFAGDLASQMQILQTTALDSSFTPESCSTDSAGCGG